MRDVVVSNGASEPRGLVITDQLGNDLSSCTFKVALALAGETPALADYIPATAVFSDDNSVATVRVQVSSATADAGQTYREWVQMTDGLDVFVLDAPEVITAS